MSQARQRALARAEFASGWRLLVACVIGIAFSVAPMIVTYTLGSFVEPLTEEFGWTRQEILTVAVFVMVSFIPANLSAGWFIDRYGARRLIMLSQIGFGAGFIALGLWTRSLTTFYLFYLLMPLLAVGTTPVTFSKVLLNQFVAGRGLALGIAMSGTGLCALLVPSMLNWVIGEWGWRAGYITAGLMPLLVALPFSFAWIRDEGPHLMSGATPRDTMATAHVEILAIDMREAMLGYRFWLLAVAFYLASGAATGLLVNIVPMLINRGFEATAAAAALGSVGVSVVAGRIVIGALVDRCWAPLVGALLLVPAGLAVGSLCQDSLSWSATLALLVAAGLAIGAETDLCPYLAARYFGVRHFGKLYAALLVFIALGAATSPPLFGWMYDRFGVYDQAMLVAGGGFILSGLVILFLGRYPAS